MVDDQRGWLHKLSYEHAISTGHNAAAAEMIERATCHCGQYVARLVFEDQDLVDSLVAVFLATAPASSALTGRRTLTAPAAPTLPDHRSD